MVLLRVNQFSSTFSLFCNMKKSQNHQTIKQVSSRYKENKKNINFVLCETTFFVLQQDISVNKHNVQKLYRKSSDNKFLSTCGLKC